MRAHFDAVFFSLVVVRQGDQYLLVEEPDGWAAPSGICQQAG